MKLKRYLIAVLLLVTATAHSATISVNPLLTNASLNQTFTVDVIGDAFLTTQGGGFSLTFDPTVLQVTNVSIDAGLWTFVNETGVLDKY